MSPGTLRGRVGNFLGKNKDFVRETLYCLLFSAVLFLIGGALILYY